MRKTLLVGFVILMLILMGVIPAMAQTHFNPTDRANYDEDKSMEAPEASSVHITINVPERRLTLYENNQIVHRFPIAVGTPYFKTPIGARSLQQIVWNPWWIPPKSDWAKNDKPMPPGPGNPLGPVKMNLGGAILLHGTNKESSVGRAASHGCMRMYNKDASTLAWWVQQRFTDQTDSSLMEKYKNNRSTSFYVKLSRYIPVQIEYEVFKIEDGFLKSHPDIYRRLEDRKRHAEKWLSTLGVNPTVINEAAMSQLLQNSQQVSSEVDLKELIPGTWNISKVLIDDPVDHAWQEKIKEQKKKMNASQSRVNKYRQPSQKTDFTFLF